MYVDEVHVILYYLKQMLKEYKFIWIRLILMNLDR